VRSLKGDGVQVPLVFYEVFQRAAGKPQRVEARFKGTRSDAHEIAIINGPFGKAAASAHVWLNGVEIAAPDAFKNAPSVLHKPVRLFDDNVLEIELAGGVGDQVAVVVK
jgi:hypothetical protein